ncbi:hypothetical protein D9M68_858760 [compost metagenome]
MPAPAPSNATASAVPRNMPCSSSAQPPVLDSMPNSLLCTRNSANSMLTATMIAASRLHSPMISRIGATTSPI